jgi:hypothetical protein
LRLALAVALVVATFAGCGGDGDDDAESSGATTPPAPTSTSTSTSTTADGVTRGTEPVGPRELAREAVEAVLTSDDPADACGRYVTRLYLEAAYGDRQGCVRAQAPGSAARSLRSFRIKSLSGPAAVVVAVPNGGPYDGTEVTIRLIGDARGYRVGSLESDVPVGP